MSIQNKGKADQTMSSIENIILPSLSFNIRRAIQGLNKEILRSVEEIRIRENRPLMVTSKNKDYLIKANGSLTSATEEAYLITHEDTSKILQLISDYSIYAIEEELRNGFITLKGGHRVGLTGKTVLEDGRIKTLKYISGFNFRISRELRGVADPVIPYIKTSEGRIYHTLIISPPQCGKTTLLRDMIRQISNGNQKMGLSGHKVGVVDERSELAGCYRGVPQNDIGIRSDVLDACPKAQGMIMLIRSMSPQIIATDEIGSKEDLLAVEEALNAGIKILTTVHGRSTEDISKRPYLKDLINNRIFERIIILSNRCGAGTIESILHGESLCNILKAKD